VPQPQSCPPGGVCFVARQARQANLSACSLLLAALALKSSRGPPQVDSARPSAPPSPVAAAGGFGYACSSTPCRSNGCRSCLTMSSLTCYRASRSFHSPFWAVCSLSGTQPEISLGWLHPHVEKDKPSLFAASSSQFNVLRRHSQAEGEAAPGPSPAWPGALGP
jgi:hypothetical protein